MPKDDASQHDHYIYGWPKKTSRIITTDEVLTEYLNFFSTAPELLRREVAETV